MFKFLFFLLFVPTCITAQVNTNLIIGTWKIEKMTSTDTSNKSINKFSDNAKGAEIVFKANGEAYSTQLKNGKIELLGSGKYSFSADEKYIYQDGNESEIIELTQTKLVLKVFEETFLYLKKKIDFRDAIITTKIFLLQAKIVNGSTKEIIPNATIKNTATNETVLANIQGDFRIKLTNTDSVLFTCVGYQNKIVCANDIEFINEISLTENKSLLSDVVVNNKPKRSIVLNDFSNCGFNWLVSGGAQSQTAQSFYIENSYTYLKKINICKMGGHTKFRVWIYDIDTITGGPSNKLVEKIIEVKSSKRNVKIDLKEFNIQIPNKIFFVAIEWLFIDENRFWEKQLGFNGIKQKVANYSPGISFSNRGVNNENICWDLMNNNNKWHKSDRDRLLISVELSQ
jgi:hypothetical protein